MHVITRASMWRISRLFAVLSLLAVSVFAQVPTEGSFLWPNPPEGWVTADIYWAAQPPEVRELRNLSDDERIEKAVELAGRGYAIDMPIMGWGWTPAVVMYARMTAGLSEAPSGINGAGNGTIKVSVLAEDYPPYDPPQPPPPARGTNLVGRYLPFLDGLGRGKLYEPGPGIVDAQGRLVVQFGETIEEGGRRFTLIGGLMGEKYFRLEE